MCLDDAAAELTFYRSEESYNRLPKLRSRLLKMRNAYPRCGNSIPTGGHFGPLTQNYLHRGLHMFDQGRASKISQGVLSDNARPASM